MREHVEKLAPQLEEKEAKSALTWQRRKFSDRRRHQGRMTQIGEQLALAAGRVLRSGRVVMTGSPTAPPSQGPAIVADDLTSGFPNAPLSLGQADLGAGGQPSVSPARVLLRRMRTALARVGGGGRPADSVEPSSLTFQDSTPVRPKRPAPALPSDVESQTDASEHILKELHRIMQEVRAEVTVVKAEVQQVRAEVTAELQQMRAELQVWRAEMEKWRAEMEKTVCTVELNEAQLRTQILGTAEGLMQVEQKLQQEVAQMCAKLEMMQHEQEKKKGNEEERLKALVLEHVGKLVKQLE